MMNKIHLIIGDDLFLLEKEIDKIIQKKNSSQNNWKKEIWRLEEKNQFQELITSLTTADFFQEKKIIIQVLNWKDLNISQEKKLIEVLKSTKHWVFLCFLKNKKQKLSWKVPAFIELHWITQINKSKKLKFIKEEFKKENVTYEPEILEWLVNKMPNNMRIIANELKKIIAFFGYQKKVLKISDVDYLVNDYQTDNIFPLIEALLLDDKKAISHCYHKIKKEKISGIYLFSILETYLFYLEKVFLLKKKDKNLNEIVKIMQKKIYFVMSLEKITKKINAEKIQILIKKMRKLEYNTKISSLEGKVLIESFFVL